MRITSNGVIIAVAVLVGVGATVISRRGPDHQVTNVIRSGQLVTVKASGRSIDERTIAEIQPWLARLRQGDAPRVPYVAGGNLVDGDIKVRLPIPAKPQIAWTLGRVAGGWLVVTQDRDDDGPTISGRYGVLTEAGHFDLIAQGRPLGAALSPDRTQLVYAVDSGTPVQLTVVDLATRQATTTLPAPGGKNFGRIDGWNVSGIWLRSAEGVMHWMPGSPPERVGDVAVHIPSTRSALLQQRVGDCDRLVAWDGGLKPQIEYCGFSQIAGVLSPDASTFITPDEQARGVYEPRAVQLELLPGVPFGDVAWEDSSHLLLTPPSTPVAVVRCDTVSGSCELALTANDLRLAPTS
jgi:hypothetical protein